MGFLPAHIKTTTFGQLSQSLRKPRKETFAGCTNLQISSQCWFIQFGAVDIKLTCPGILGKGFPIEAHLADIQSATNGDHSSRILNSKVASTVANTARPAYITRMRIP